MRKIEFRGIAKDHNCAVSNRIVNKGEWLFGDLHTHEDGKTFWVDSWHVEPATIGQYVCQDKKKQKTYEGDIVEYGKEKSRFVVEWDESECGFILRCTDDSAYILKGAMLHKAVVIGNRHDNPELLQGAGNAK